MMAEPDAPKAAQEQQTQKEIKGESNPVVKGHSNSQHNNHHSTHSVVTIIEIIHSQNHPKTQENQSQIQANKRAIEQNECKIHFVAYLSQTIGRGTFGKVKLGIHKITNEKIFILFQYFCNRFSSNTEILQKIWENRMKMCMVKAVAVKVLDKDKLIDSADKKRLQREISILRKIRHPNIIQLYEIIETPRQLYLFMEYAPNGELFDYIVKRTRLSERQASKFLQQIINGIEYIAKIGVVHRDLKPENLLLDHNFNIKIVDFGLSNTYKENEKLKTACGSPCYAAPEMVAGKLYNGLQTDIWSSGVILYAMLCGYLPFEDQNTSVLYKKIMNQEPAYPSFLSTSSKGILSGVLTKDPEKRYSIQDIRLHPFCKEREAVMQGIVVGVQEIPIDRNILKQLEKYQVNLEEAEDMIKRNKHNNITSIYNLLLLKFIREGGKSNADLQIMKKTRSDNFNSLKMQNITNLSQQQETRQKISNTNGIGNTVAPILQTVSTAAPPSVAIHSNNNAQGQDNVTKFSIQHNQLHHIFQNLDPKDKEDIKDSFSPVKHISTTNPVVLSIKPRETSHQPRDSEQLNKERYQNKYHSVSPTREINSAYENNSNKHGKQNAINLQLKPELVDIPQHQKGVQTEQKLATLLDNTLKQNLPRLNNGVIHTNPQQKRIPMDKTRPNGYMIQSTYQKKQNNFIDINNTSSSQQSVPSQLKKPSIVRINNLNNSSMFEDTKDSQKHKINSSFQYVNASKYSVGDEEDKLIMVNSVQTNSVYKNGKQQNSKRNVLDSALNTTQESPKSKHINNSNNLSMLLQKNYHFPSNIPGNKSINPNNTSLNSFNKTRYLSVQRQQNQKLASQSPSIEEKKNFRISSYSIHMRGNSTQYNTRNSNDSVLNLSMNQAITQNQSKRASINSIKQQPIPLQEKLININVQNNINQANKRIRKKIISMHETSYNNNSKQSSFNAGRMNKENAASNSASKQEIKIVNNMEFLSYGSVHHNPNNYSLELDLDTTQKNLQQTYQTQVGTRGNKFEGNGSLLIPKGIQRIHTDENDKSTLNKNNSNKNQVKPSQQVNTSFNNSSATSSRNKKPEQSKSENIKLNKILPFQIQMAQISNNSMLAANNQNQQINQNSQYNSNTQQVTAGGGGSSQSSSRMPSYKFRKVKPNHYEDQFNFIVGSDNNEQ